MAKRTYLDTITRDGIVYGRTSTGSLIVQNGRTAKCTTIGIPAQINGMPVIGVDERAFANSSVKNILLPKTVILVDEGAFYNALNLKTVEFESERVALGRNAFTGCFKLQKIKGKTLQTTGESVFYQCKNLTEIEAEFSGEVWRNTFGLCKRLQEIQFADGVKIHADAFYGCMSVKTLYFATKADIPASIMKFVEKRQIVCNEDSNLAELAYTGTDVILAKVDG